MSTATDVTKLEATIHDAFHYCRAGVRRAAIEEALRVARRGGAFFDCLDAAERVVESNGYRLVRGCLMFVAAQCERDLEQRLVILRCLLQRHLCGRHMHQADAVMARAERVVRGGGDVFRAIHVSLGGE